MALTQLIAPTAEGLQALSLQPPWEAASECGDPPSRWALEELLPESGKAGCLQTSQNCLPLAQHGCIQGQDSTVQPCTALCSLGCVLGPLCPAAFLLEHHDRHGKRKPCRNTEEPVYLHCGWDVTTHWRGLILPVAASGPGKCSSQLPLPHQCRPPRAGHPRHSRQCWEGEGGKPASKPDELPEAGERGRSQVKGCTGTAGTWKQLLLGTYCQLFSQNFTCLSHLARLRSFLFLGEMAATWKAGRGTDEMKCVHKKSSLCWAPNQPAPAVASGGLEFHPAAPQPPSSWAQAQTSCTSTSIQLKPLGANLASLHRSFSPFSLLNSGVWAAFQQQCLHCFLCINSSFLMRLENPCCRYLLEIGNRDCAGFRWLHVLRHGSPSRDLKLGMWGQIATFDLEHCELLQATCKRLS